jgi:hypothetical protein
MLEYKPLFVAVASAKLYAVPVATVGSNSFAGSMQPLLRLRTTRVWLACRCCAVVMSPAAARLRHARYAGIVESGIVIGRIN